VTLPVRYLKRITGENPMTMRKYFMCLIMALGLMVFIPPMQAASDDNSVDVIYQTSFSTDPHWITNNPSTNYWDPNLGMYHFSIEPSTGGYAYTDSNYDKGSFTFEYDINITELDNGATFRFGLTGNEMDPSKGPNVLSMFTNDKYGRIMWLHLVTPGNKLMEINSQSGDTLTSGPSAYSGPTVKYELNKPYHVTVNYDDDHKILSIKVNEKLTGKEIWGYFINTGESLSGMTRLFVGSKGDYGAMNVYALGYIDNVRLSIPVAATPSPTRQLTSLTTVTTKNPTPKQTSSIPTPYPTTQKSPEPGILAISAVCMIGIWAILGRIRKN
jgi:hypothetical protein